MGAKRTTTHNSYESAVAAVGLLESPTVPDALLSLNSISHNPNITARQRAVHQALHVTAIEAILLHGVDQYDESRYSKESFHRQIAHAEHITLPSDALAAIAHRLIDRSLDATNGLSHEARVAATDMALALGDDAIAEAKATHIGKKIEKSLNGEEAIDVDAAHQLLDRMGYEAQATEKPSTIDAVGAYAKNHVPAVATVITTMVVAGSVLAPSVAQAAEPPGSSQTPNAPDGRKTIQVGASADPSDSTPQKITISPNSPVGAQPSQEAKTVNVGASEFQPDASNPVPVPAPKPISIAPVQPPQTPTVAVEPSPDSDQPTPAPSSGQSNKNTDAAPSAPVNTPPAISFAPNVQQNPTDPHQTPEQSVVQTIQQQIDNDDIDKATAQILLGFHSGTAPTIGMDAEGNPMYAVTNQALVDTVNGLIATNAEVIGQKAHSDVAYINNTLTALTVLRAVATDQSVLQTNDGQPSAVAALLNNIQRPSDAYQARAFDTYLQTAKSTLEANDSALMKGITTLTPDRLEQIYAYILMAQKSDSDIAAQIQGFKDADAKAAAEAAAAKAAEKTVSPDQILTTAITQAAAKYGWSNNETILFTVAAQNGASAAAIAGLGGNVFAESGFNPAAIEHGSGIGRGFIQESYGRRKAMEAAAAADGADVDDPTWQAHYIINESKNRTQRDNSHKNEWAEFITMTDPVAASDYWLYNNERAGIPHSHTREAKASEIFTQLNGEIASIQAANAAAEAAAAQAAAEKAILDPISDLVGLLNHTLISAQKEAELMPAGDPNNGKPGQCTSWVYILKARMGKPLPNHLGDATDWADRLGKAGYGVDTTPAIGSIMQISGIHQHVALVIAVDQNARTFTVSEMNKKGFGAFHIDQRVVSFDEIATSGIKFIHDK